MAARGDPDPIGLGRRVAEARKEAGLSCNKLDLLIGASRGFTSRLENGKRGGQRAEHERYTKLAEVLEVRLEWLLRGELPKRGAGSDDVDADPLVGTFLLRLERSPGLRRWVDEHPGDLTISQLARGMAFYETAPPLTRADGTPRAGWGAYLQQVLSGEVHRGRVPSRTEAASIERQHMKLIRGGESNGTDEEA